MLQIQPLQSAWGPWTALAEKENLSYEVLELSMPPYLGADRESTAPAEALYGQSGRVSALHGAFIDVNPASGDSAFRALSERRCRESCELAMRLGARHVVFHSGAAPFLRGAYLQGWAASTAAFFSGLARDYPGLCICLENSQDVDAEPLRRVMELAEGAIGVCLDLGHANYSRAPLTQWLDALGDYIGYVHLSDNLGQFDDHLPLGAGTVDWALADRLWRALGRDTPITLEVGGLDGVEQSLAYLKQNRFFETEA